ncbi:MAG: 4-(cytidine 5'-diphospho)-2-C-methyl-D-erythritol kinase [Pseudomonadota bacterium]|nr:4-(cytidine 5'-diphospho)-2-C-methyl-D-erythritol kinase [Pseudomonadota bacterium]
MGAGPLSLRPGFSAWPAPAKLNLFLHILGRRADGFHLLQTVFQLLDWGDTVHLAARPDGRIQRLNDLPGVPEPADLSIRAAQALREYSGCTLGADIDIDKRIPAGAGLGGGSSDAASTLVGLNHLWGLELSVDELADIGLKLGADVPVFVRGQCAWAEGIGEKLQAIELPDRWFLVISPPCQVSTATIFGDPELRRDHPPVSMDDFLSGRCGNDCEPVTRRGFPAVDAAFDHCRALGLQAQLSGTGASLFMTFNSQACAQAAQAQIQGTLPTVLARGLQRSTLLHALGIAAN